MKNYKLNNKELNTIKNVDQLKIDSISYKSLTLNNRQLCDLELILNGAFSDVTNGATFFHASEVSPSWSKKFKKTRKIGRHIFYKN